MAIITNILATHGIEFDNTYFIIIGVLMIDLDKKVDNYVYLDYLGIVSPEVSYLPTFIIN